MNATTRIGSTLSLALLGCSLVAAAQQSPVPNSGSLESPVTASSVDHHIALDVVVTDRKGQLISGLVEQDFTLLDNKQPQKLTSFRAVIQSVPQDPLEVIVLIDAVNSSFLTVSYERDQIQKFLKQNGGKLAYPVSLIFFTDENTQVGTKPTRDGNELIAAFDNNVSGLRTIRRSQGIYGAVDRFQLSLRTLSSLTRYEATRPGRKLLLWISPGWPILSSPRIDISNRESERLFSSVVDMSAALRRARITLYAVDPLGTNDAGSLHVTYYEEFLKGVTKPGSTQAGNLALQVLAVQSGGLVLYANNDITAQIARCAADAGSYYILSYDPAPADGPNDYRAIEVNVDKPGMKVRTRTGYYAQP